MSTLAERIAELEAAWAATPEEEKARLNADAEKYRDVVDAVAASTAALRESRLARRAAFEALEKSTAELRCQLEGLEELDRLVSMLEALQPPSP